MQTAALGVFDVRCFSPAGGPGGEEHAEVTEIVLPTSGVFAVHHRRNAVVADVASVVILTAGHEYRVGHPVDGGDRSTVMIFPPEVAEDALGDEPGDGGLVGPRVQLGVRALRSSLRPGRPEPLEAEELALLLLDRIGHDLGAASPGRLVGRLQRDRVQEVRALVGAEPGRRWRLGEIARLVHCSPYHLARQFRAIAGESIATYLFRLRLALALQRLAEGETDLAGLAADLGFASHSHFSARFRSAFGASPGSVRGHLRAGRLAELRTIVTAPDLAAS